MKKKTRLIQGVLILTTMGLLSSCSQINKVFDNNVTDYKNSGSVKSLEVPPDLTAPEYDKTFVFEARKGGYPQQGSGEVSTAVLASNAPTLKIRDSYQRTWLRTGAALRNIGFILEGQNKSKGLYAALWDKAAPRSNLLTRFMSSRKAFLPKGTQVVVHVRKVGRTTELRLLDRTGQALQEVQARKVLESLREALD